jgi:hypothetical protein
LYFQNLDFLAALAPLQRSKDKVALDELVSLTKAFFAKTYSPPVATDSTHPRHAPSYTI